VQRLIESELMSKRLGGFRCVLGAQHLDDGIARDHPQHKEDKRGAAPDDEEGLDQSPDDVLGHVTLRGIIGPATLSPCSTSPGRGRSS
jgi:hypothetical protein